MDRGVIERVTEGEDGSGCGGCDIWEARVC